MTTEQIIITVLAVALAAALVFAVVMCAKYRAEKNRRTSGCLLYTSDAADEL